MSNGDGIKKVAIYTRVSTEDQARGGFSLEYQLEKLRAFCIARDWGIAGEYIEKGESGTTTNRPQYKKMVADIDKWDGILVIKMDRVHRSQTNFTSMMAFLNKHYKHFVSMTESYDTSTAIGRLLMDFSVRLAQFESEQTGERTYIGMHQKAKQRGYTGHRACVGYRAVKTDVIGKAGKNLSKLVPIPKDLAIVKEIYELYNEGLSMTELAERFKDVKVEDSKRTKYIKFSTIQYILKNPLYMGYYKWHDILKKADDLEPIISKTLFDLVQKKKAVTCNQNGPRVKPKYKPLLMKDKDVFEIPREKIKDMPAIHRAKHNLSY